MNRLRFLHIGVAGALLALAILAMTVGLIRSESAGDLRILTATGATPRIRRTLTAATAGALALLGAVLGVAGAYVAAGLVLFVLTFAVNAVARIVIERRKAFTE